MPDPHPHEPPPLKQDLVHALVRYVDAMQIIHVIEHGATAPSAHVATVRALIDRIHRATATGAPHFTPHDVALLTEIVEELIAGPRPATGDRRRPGRLPATPWSRALGDELLVLRDHLRSQVAERTPTLADVRCGDELPTREE
jgi:hypothetical protein